MDEMHKTKEAVRKDNWERVNKERVGNMKKRLLAILSALALVVGLLPLTALADPIDTDVVIHKMSVDTGTGLAQHNGEEITDFTGTNLEDSEPVAGVIFKYWTVAPTATAAQLAAIKGLANIAQCEAYAAANPTILTGGTTTSATGADGTVRINGMAEGIYLFAEVNGADLNVSEYIGVPFVLELPAMKADGRSYFGTGTNALHVYPKNVLRSPGVDLETRDDNGTAIGGARIGSSDFLVYMKNTAGTYVLVAGVGTAGRIALPSGFITLASLPAGEYQLVNVAAPTGYLTDDRPIYFSVSGGAITFDGTNSNPKSYFTAGTGGDNDMITLLLRREPGDPEKEVDGEMEGTYQIGDTFTYTVRLGVPSDIIEYAEYKMTDVLDSQLSWAGTDGEGDVVVRSGATTLTLGTHYTKTVMGDTLILEFDPTTLGAYAGATLTITYRVIINDTAVMGVDLENNVTFDFDNGHGATGSKEPPPPIVWTGGVKFLKVDGKDDNVLLAGAEFKIATDAAGTSFLSWTAPLIAANMTGSFITPVVGEDIVMVSNASGRFEIKGLAGGTYYLVETKAPIVGDITYNLLRDPAPFVVTKTSYETGQELVVENNAGIQIPRTGGIGTAIFSVSGALLMILGVFLFRRKKGSQE